MLTGQLKARDLHDLWFTQEQSKGKAAEMLKMIAQPSQLVSELSWTLKRRERSESAMLNYTVISKSRVT